MAVLEDDDDKVKLEVALIVLDFNGLAVNDAIDVCVFDTLDEGVIVGVLIWDLEINELALTETEPVDVLDCLGDTEFVFDTVDVLDCDVLAVLVRVELDVFVWGILFVKLGVNVLHILYVPE